MTFERNQCSRSGRGSKACVEIDSDNVLLSDVHIHGCAAGIDIDSGPKANVTVRASLVDGVMHAHGVTLQSGGASSSSIVVEGNVFVNVVGHCVHVAAKNRIVQVTREFLCFSPLDARLASECSHCRQSLRSSRGQRVGEHRCRRRQRRIVAEQRVDRSKQRHSFARRRRATVSLHRALVSLFRVQLAATPSESIRVDADARATFDRVSVRNNRLAGALTGAQLRLLFALPPVSVFSN